MVTMQERGWRAPEQFSLWSVMGSSASSVSTRKCPAGTQYRLAPNSGPFPGPSTCLRPGVPGGDSAESWVGLGLFPEGELLG